VCAQISQKGTLYERRDRDGAPGSSRWAWSASASPSPSPSRLRLGSVPKTSWLNDADLERVGALASAGEVEALAAALPEAERDAVRLRVVEERTYPEIAAEMRCSEMVVRKRVSRGLSRLRRQLEGR
jgi:RNA polymerase sigma-70 factor (ECF subfamily)